jgi:putative transposase
VEEEPSQRPGWADTHLLNAALDIHHDDPTIGYRLDADELVGLGVGVDENRVRRWYSQQRICSLSFGNAAFLQARAADPRRSGVAAVHHIQAR